MTSDKQEQVQLKGDDISPAKDGCLLKEIVQQGVDGETPTYDDKVFIHYVGTRLDGTIFESSRDRDEQVSFSLGRGEVLKAWDIGVATMKRGEIARVTSKPKFAYGLKGKGEQVGSAETVIFEIELIDFQGKDLSEERDGSIIRRIMKKGEGYETPNEDATVEIRLIGTHQGRVFDERTLTFFAGSGCVRNIPSGVERAVFRMTKGEHCKLYLKSKATRGVENFDIPPDSPVEYEVIVIKLELAKEDRSLSEEQKLEQSEMLKPRADELLKGGYYELAIKKYKTIFNYLLNAALRSDSHIQKSRQLKLAVHSNTALCYLKLGAYEECKRECDSALMFDSENEKSIFRRGQCQLATCNFDAAIQDFQTVLKLNPSNAAAKQQIQECHQQIRAYKGKQKELYFSILNKGAKANAAEKADETKESAKGKKTSFKST